MWRIGGAKDSDMIWGIVEYKGENTSRMENGNTHDIINAPLLDGHGNGSTVLAKANPIHGMAGLIMHRQGNVVSVTVVPLTANKK